MSHYDQMYADLVRNIIDYGYSDEKENVRPRYADGTPAHTLSLISERLSFSGSEVPILTTKRVAWKTAIHEIIWFYVKRTSDASYLQENNVTIWDEWIDPITNSIGKAYGYQLGKGFWVKRNKLGTNYLFVNQVDNLIYELKNNPNSRRHIISLWDIDDLHQMALPPCVWHNQWLVKDGKLHLIVGIRSNDTALGQPFNVFQYYVLQRMIAQVTGYEIGTLTFNINDCHIYTRHINGLKEQIEREPLPAPQLLINPDIKNFDDFTINDFQLVGYEYHPSIQFEIAI